MFLLQYYCYYYEYIIKCISLTVDWLISQTSINLKFVIKYLCFNNINPLPIYVLKIISSVFMGVCDGRGVRVLSLSTGNSLYTYLFSWTYSYTKKKYKNLMIKKFITYYFYYLLFIIYYLTIGTFQRTIT